LDSGAWTTVGTAHVFAANLLKKGNPRVSQAVENELMAHFQRLSAIMPGGATWLGNVVGTLGTTFKDLANKIEIAAKWTGKAFTDVTQSPLWKVVAGAAIVIPGIGVAVSAGMVAAAAIGKKAAELNNVVGAAKDSIQDVAGKAGFEIGMGLVVNGKGMTEADVTKVREQVPNGSAKAGFDAALNLSMGAATTVLPTTTGMMPREKEAMQSPVAKAAFYTTAGLVKAKAPPAMKVAVSKMIITNPTAQVGLHTAVSEIGGKEISWLEWIWHEVKNTGAKVYTTILQPKPKTIVTVRGERLL